jgi:colanic acid biosynthesis glycosyl transferase WcaI
MRQPAARPFRLLVISHLFAPDVCGGAAIFSDMCYGLAEREIEVTVRCGYPYYPEWKDKSGHNGLRIQQSSEKGVQIERYGMFIPRNPSSPAQRALYEGSYFLSLCRSLFRPARFDATMVLCPLAGSVAFAALYKMLLGGPLWLNVQDLPADAASASRIIGPGVVQELIQSVQRWLFNRADVWSSISPVMVERLEALRERGQPILFLPNWLHQSMAHHIQAQPSKVGRIPGQPVRLLYAGNIGAKQDLLGFCKQLAGTKTSFRFQIHGDGGAADDVRQWLTDSSDRRFSFGPVLNESEFARALYDTDFFVITEKPGGGASFFPSKTVPGLASGTPILSVSDPESALGREMREHHVGPCFTWASVSQVGDLLESIAGRPGEFVGWQRNAISRSQAFARERCLTFIKSTLDDIVVNQIDQGAKGVLDGRSARLPI